MTTCCTWVNTVLLCRNVAGAECEGPVIPWCCVVLLLHSVRIEVLVYLNPGCVEDDLARRCCVPLYFIFFSLVMDYFRVMMIILNVYVLFFVRIAIPYMTFMMFCSVLFTFCS